MALDRDTGLTRSQDATGCQVTGPNHSELSGSHSRPRALADTGQEWATSQPMRPPVWCCQPPTHEKPQSGGGAGSEARGLRAARRRAQEGTVRRALTVEWEFFLGTEFVFPAPRPPGFGFPSSEQAEGDRGHLVQTKRSWCHALGARPWAGRWAGGSLGLEVGGPGAAAPAGEWGVAHGCSPTCRARAPPWRSGENVRGTRRWRFTNDAFPTVTAQESGREMAATIHRDGVSSAPGIVDEPQCVGQA